MMNISYDSTLSKMFYENLSPLVKDRACPFCGHRLNVSNFAGLFFFKDEPRLLHKNLTCLLQYNDLTELEIGDR